MVEVQGLHRSLFSCASNCGTPVSRHLFACRLCCHSHRYSVWSKGDVPNELIADSDRGSRSNGAIMKSLSLDMRSLCATPMQRCPHCWGEGLCRKFSFEAICDMIALHDHQRIMREATMAISC